MSGCNGYLGFFRWRPIMGVMAAGVLACSLTMQGASADTNKSATGGFSPFVYKGYPVPVESIPMAAPVQAHSPELFIFEGEATRPFITVPSDEGNDGIAAALTQNPITGCELDIECDDCNPCTADTCDLGVGCVHTPLEDCDACDDGIFCNGQEVCDSGVCVAATAVKRFLCNGGPFDGRSCPKGDGDCDFCTDGDRAGEKCCPGIQGSGVGGDCVGGVCQGGSRDQQACCPNGTCDTTPVCKL